MPAHSKRKKQALLQRGASGKFGTQASAVTAETESPREVDSEDMPDLHDVSLLVARNFVRGPYCARSIRSDARYFEKHGQLPPPRRSKQSASGSLLDDESVHMGVQRWLRCQETGKITPGLLRDYVNKTLLPELEPGTTKGICRRTAIRWMWKLGYRRKRHSKGVFWDGHERKDVKKSRVIYLDETGKLALRQRVYSGDGMAPELLELKDGEKEVILLFHDESAYHANDFQRDYWLRPGEQVLKKKERGRLIMVSDFICEDCGFLALSDDEKAAMLKLPKSKQLSATEARVIIKPDNKSTGDSYWNLEQMMQQLKTALDIAQFKWPRKELVFVFDNSSCHNSLAEDALNVNKMNVGPGGKQKKLHDTVIPDSNPDPALRRKAQAMVFPDDHPDEKLRGQAKGMRIVLQERGLVDENGRNRQGRWLPGQCKACKTKRARKPHLTGPTDDELAVDLGEEDDDGEDDDDGVECCLQRLLSREDDFRNEQSELEKLIEARGAKCLFLPKFHPELNPIELVWGWSKRYFRKRSTGNFKLACNLVPESLDACPLVTMRRFFQRVYRYMSVYRLGATGLLAEYAVRKYRSHRSILSTDLATVTAENEGKAGPGKGWAKGKKRKRAAGA